MAKVGILGVGIVLLIIAIIGYVIPVTDTNYSIPNVASICNSGFGQLGQAFSGDVVKICSEYNMMLYGIYGSGLVGVILLIVGAVIPSKSKAKSLTCDYCNFVAMSEPELLKHAGDNHLEKSSFKCEHCDFIGISEEILWNHYEDKHPDAKKWKWN